MGGSGGNENAVARLDDMNVAVESQCHLSFEDNLLVFDGVMAVTGDSAAGHQRESPGGEVRNVVIGAE